MSARIALALAIILLVISGCAHPNRWFTNRSMVRDTLVRLPDDGAVFIEVEQVEGLGKPQRRATHYVWEQPGRPRKVLNPTGALPADTVDLASVSSSISEDGNVAELFANGRVIPRFDYAAGTATFPP